MKSLFNDASQLADGGNCIYSDRIDVSIKLTHIDADLFQIAFLASLSVILSLAHVAVRFDVSVDWTIQIAVKAKQFPSK